MAAPILLTGSSLTPERVRCIAREGAEVRIADAAAARIAAAHQVVLRAARSGTPVYGVTTGLGSRVTEAVAGGGAEFSLRTIRGRATAVGEPLSVELTRAALVLRCNGICAGGSGASPAVAPLLAGMLNEGVHPVIPSSGSVGAADLCLMAHVGLAMLGEGEAEFSGVRMGSAQALSAAGLLALSPGPKDGVAICSANSVSAGAAALALADARALLDGAQISAALSMEGFRAALTPLDPRVVKARPQPGQEWSASGLRGLLAGGSLTEPGAARRLQDPLSFRCASQLHGSLYAALALLAAALEPELNGAADNPLVLTDDDQIVSTGNFQVPALALALDAVAIGIAQVASAIAQRQSRLKVTRLSGLPRGLVEHDDADPTRTGLAALTKTAESLVLEIRQRAAPVAIHSIVSGDGVEDDSTGAAQAALRLIEQLTRLRLLIATELLVAAQATELAAPDRLGAGTAEALRCVREVVTAVTEDRALGPDVERIARTVLAGDALRGRVHDAAAPAAAEIRT
jgi:histidine ammonia-lyase